MALLHYTKAIVINYVI